MMAVIRYLIEMYKFMRLPASQRQALIRQAETQARLRKAIPSKPAPKPAPTSPRGEVLDAPDSRRRGSGTPPAF